MDNFCILLQDLIRQLADTVSKGGNLLVDVGPTKEGTIPVIMQERLLQMGGWLRINGEAVHEIELKLNFFNFTFFVRFIKRPLGEAIMTQPCMIFTTRPRNPMRPPYMEFSWNGQQTTLLVIRQKLDRCPRR